MCAGQGSRDPRSRLLLQATHLPAHSLPFDDPEQSASAAASLARALLRPVSGRCLLLVIEAYPFDGPSAKQIECLATIHG